MVWTGSGRCRGRELHVIGPATEKARRLYEHVTDFDRNIARQQIW